MTTDRAHMDCWSGTKECYLHDPHCPMSPEEKYRRHIEIERAKVEMDKPCPHESFAAEVAVGRITETDDGPVTAYSAEIKVECATCGEKFRFIGVQAGLMPNKPMCSMDEFTLFAPIRPASADPDFGLGIPGYAVNFRRGTESEHANDQAD